MKALRLVGLLVLFLGLSVFSVPCHAKPVQLLDYDAQTFFENYKKAYNYYAPHFGTKTLNNDLTLKKEPKSHGKYTFYVNENVYFTVYENKTGRVSSINVTDNGEGIEEENGLPLEATVVILQKVLGLDHEEATLLNKDINHKESMLGAVISVDGEGRTYCKAKQRYIYRLLSTIKIRTIPNDITLYSFVANDEE